MNIEKVVPPSVHNYDPCSDSDAESDTDTDDEDEGDEADEGEENSLWDEIVTFRDDVEATMFQLAQDYRFVRQLHGSEKAMIYHVVDTSNGDNICLKIRYRSSCNSGVPVEAILLYYIKEVHIGTGLQILDTYYHDNDMCVIASPMYEAADTWFEDMFQKTSVPAMSFATQLLHRIDDLHRLGVMWRDCKPSNMAMVPEGKDSTLYLLDFDLAFYSADPANCERTSVLGTDGFMSSLILSKGPYGFEQDYYSAGVCIGMLLFSVIETDVSIEIVREWRDTSPIGHWDAGWHKLHKCFLALTASPIDMNLARSVLNLPLSCLMVST